MRITEDSGVSWRITEILSNFFRVSQSILQHSGVFKRVPKYSGATRRTQENLEICWRIPEVPGGNRVNLPA
jgi:hypothetical protein